MAFALAFLLLAATRPALAQQLTYDTRTEIRTFQPDPVDPHLDRVIDEAGRQLRQLVLDGIERGVANSKITLGDRAVRVEHTPDGTVEIIRNDRDVLLESATPRRDPRASSPRLAARITGYELPATTYQLILVDDLRDVEHVVKA